jgi:hypothetical protein
MVFMFFLWAVLESDFLTKFTDNLLATSMTTPMPFSVNGDGSFSAGIGPANIAVNLTDMSKTLSGNFGTHDSSVLVLSLLMMFLFLSFWGSIISDVAMQIIEFMKQPTFMGGFLFAVKWIFFISFITNFSFFIFIFAWFYFVIITFFGYFFARNNVKHDFIGDFFKNTYSNILQLDLTRLKLIQELKNLRNSTSENQSMINQITDNIATYYWIQNSIISVIQYTQKSPFLTGLTIFITFCFTTIMIEIGQIANVSISFFIFNLLLFFLFLIALAILYFGFNVFKDYNNYSSGTSPTDTTNSLKDKFKNIFNDIIGINDQTTTTQSSTSSNLTTNKEPTMTPKYETTNTKFRSSFNLQEGGGATAPMVFMTPKKI